MNRSKKQRIESHSLSPRQTRVLFCLAQGETVAGTARKLKMSRTTIYKLLDRADFRQVLLQEQRNLAESDIVFRRSLRYRESLLKALVRLLRPLPKGDKVLKKFITQLRKIDGRAGLKDYDMSSERVYKDMMLKMQMRKCPASMRQTVAKMVSNRRRKWHQRQVESAKQADQSASGRSSADHEPEYQYDF